MTSPTLADQIATAQVSVEHLTAWWLGGSGFVLKTSGGLRIYIDPYLSDVVNKIFGVARAFPTPIRAEDVQADCIISTHWHEDHLDPQVNTCNCKKLRCKIHHAAHRNGADFELGNTKRSHFPSSA